MGVITHLNIIAIDKNGNRLIDYDESISTEDLAYMLKDKVKNSTTGLKLKEHLSKESINAINVTYHDESASVYEQGEEHNPAYMPPDKLSKIFIRIRDYFSFNLINNKDLSQDALKELLYEIQIISEFIAILYIAEKQNLEVALTIRDE